MKRLTTSNPFLYTTGILLVFLLWALISFSFGQGNLIFPNPVDTISFAFSLFGNSYFYQSLGMSLLRTLYGFGVSFAIALVLGSLAGEIKILQKVLRPLIIVFKSAPTAAFVFLFLLLSGSSRAPVWVVSLLAFPILYDSVVSGINAIPKEIIWASRVDEGTFLSTLLRIKIPLSAPYIFLGLMNSFALSFKTEIMAEIITGDTGKGLGGMIRLYRNEDPSNLVPVFAIALVAIVIILLFDAINMLLHRIFKLPEYGN